MTVMQPVFLRTENAASVRVPAGHSMYQDPERLLQFAPQRKHA